MIPTPLVTDAAGLDFLAGGGAMGRLMRALDWSQTPLGPIAAWPQSLRSAVSICLNSRFPIALYWGPELALLYNDAWSQIPGEKHPWALGRSGREVWPEIWETIGPLYAQVQATGEGVWLEDQLLPMHRYGYTEECYFNFTFSPIRGEGGRVEGIFNAVVETTFRVIEERRTRTLRELGEHTAAARSAEQVCLLAAGVLGVATADLPFCLLYLFDGPADLFKGLGRARLVASAGLPADGPASLAAFAQADAGAPWPWASALASGRVEWVTGSDARLPDPVTGSVRPGADGAFVAPIAGPSAERPAGFLVAGKSPRRATDDAYHAFIQRVAAQLSAAIANARAYAEERRRAEALAEIDRAKTLFFSNISHEFRTPLTLMTGPLEELLAQPEGRIPTDARALLEVARRNTSRLLKLVNSLLDFSRVEAGRAQASFAPVDLAAFTAELAGVFRSACEQAGLTLAVDCPPLPAPVHVDRELWEKIVLNLLSNAFKFTLEGGITVSLHPSADARRVELAVRDTGTGIPAGEIPRLFERFYRVQGAQGRSHEGSGIGLALVQELVRLHGGEVSAISAPGRGSTFSVSIPFGAEHLPVEHQSGEHKPGERRRAGDGPAATVRLADAFVGEALGWLPGAGPADAPVRALADAATGPADTATDPGEAATNLSEARGAPVAATPRPRVLLADDNADMRDYLRRLLAGDYEVSAVGDGRAALAAVAERVPDLVLTDVMMPGLDGFGLLRALRADPATAMVPVLLLSARAGEEARVEGLAAGADDYLVKPFSARELLARVSGTLNLARVRREAARREAALKAETVRVLESITDGFIALDTEWRFTYVNAAAERINGMARAELLGRSHWEVFPAALDTTVDRELRRAMMERVPVRFENYYAPWDRWFEVSAYPVEGGGLAVYYRDVTARKRALDALRAREERFRVTADHAPVLIWVTDPDKARVWFNRPWHAFTGRPLAQERGDGWAQGIHPDDRGRCLQSYAQHFDARTPFSMEYRLRRHDGEYRWVLDNGVALYGPGGEFTGYIGTATDITDQKQTEAALREREARFRALFYAIDEGYCLAEMVEDADGRPVDYRFLEVNPPFETMTGLAGAAGYTALELVPGLEPHWVRTYARVALGGESLRFESGSQAMGRWFDVFATPVEPRGRFALVIKDVTERRRADQALRESEGRFRSMADAAPAMLWVTEADGTCSFLSRGWFEFTGQTEDQALGFGWLQAVHPEDRGRVRAEFLAAHAARRSFAIEHRLHRADGSYGWVIDAGRPRHSPASEVRPGESRPGESRSGESLADGSRTGADGYRTDGSGHGEFLGYVGNVFDIGERKRAEDRLRFLAALADATQPLADPDAITATAARLLGEHLRADRCAYAEVDADEDHFAVTGDHCRGVASIVGRYRMADFGTEVLSAMRINRPYVVADVDTDPQAGPDLAAYRQTQIRAVVCVPLHKDGRFVAALAVHQSAPRAWATEEVDLVQLVAGRVWESIERARVARHLRDSEAQFRQLAETIPNLAWMAHPDGEIFWYNRRWYEYTGTTPAEMAGWGWQRVHDPKSLPRVLERWRASLGSGAPFDMVFPLKGRDGVFRPFLTLVNPLRGPDGRIQFWFGTNTDVSAQKRAEDTAQFLADVSAALAELVDPRDTLRRVATLAVPRFADGCAVDLIAEDASAAPGAGETGPREAGPREAGSRETGLRETGPRETGLSEAGAREAGAGSAGGRLERLAVVHANPDRARQARELFDRHPPRLANARGVGRVLASGEADWAEDVDDAVLQAVAEDAGHLRLLRALGLRSYLCVPLRLRDRTLGTITFITAESGRRYGPDDLRVAEDLARRITVALENARLYHALQEADRRKDEFLATLAHELRNPLAPVRTGLEVLKLAPPGPVADAARAMMERQLGHMVRLVDDLLDVSRVSRGKLELKKTRITLQVVLDAALETSRPALEAGRHTLRVSIPGEPVWLDADLTRLAQVVGNLLANAAKYTPDGGHVILDARREGNEALVSVSDDGLGIPPEMLDRVFEMFAQVNRTLDRAQGGLGIGLALVRRLVDMHGGTVTAASPGPGRGSTFTLRLPVADAIEVSARPPAGDAAPGGQRILVVDDNRDAAESLSLMLELSGHDVRSAHDGPAALEIVRGFIPEVVFLDIGMPGMDGYAVARRLRADSGLAGAVLVALTGWGSEDDKRRAGEAGFDHHLTKPVAAQEVVEVLARFGPARPGGG